MAELVGGVGDRIVALAGLDGNAGVRRDEGGLIALLSRVGDQAREEASRGPFGQDPTLLPVLVQLLCAESDARQHGSESTLSEAAARDADQRVRVSAAAARALGNIVVENDENRRRCADLGAVTVLIDILKGLLIDKHSDVASNATLERNVLGSLGNLSCDNRFLQDAIVSSGGGQWIVRAAINGSARAMACNAARCLDSVLVLESIAFWHVDNNTSINASECEVVSTVLEALFDLTDDPEKIEDMKRSPNTTANAAGVTIEAGDGAAPASAATANSNTDVGSPLRSWPESLIALGGLILGAREAGEDSTTDNSSGWQSDADAVLEAQHHCAGLLSQSYKIHGPTVYDNLSSGAVATLSTVVTAYCTNYDSSSPDSAFETLGIYASVLASVCSSLDGCAMCFEADAFGGLVSAAKWEVDKNKAVRSTGLQALRNLCLACHQQCENEDARIPHPVAFVEANDIVGVALRAAQHANNNLALSGVAMLRQAIGNSVASPAVMADLLRRQVGENEMSAMAWLAEAFHGDGLADGNKGQCECARIVCAVIVRIAEIPGTAPALSDGDGLGSLEKVLGATSQSLYKCVSLLESFADAKVQQEGEKARSILATLDVGESKN